MALFSECTPWCARKGLDTADIVREAWFRQQSTFCACKASTEDVQPNPSMREEET